MSILPDSMHTDRYKRPTAVCGAILLSMILMLPGAALLGNRHYHHPFTPGGAQGFEAARNLAPITEWGTIMIIAGILVPLIFSKDAWVLGTFGCLIGFVVLAFLTVSFLSEVGAGIGWFGAAESGPACIASFTGMVLSTREHMAAHVHAPSCL